MHYFCPRDLSKIYLDSSKGALDLSDYHSTSTMLFIQSCTNKKGGGYSATDFRYTAECDPSRSVDSYFRAAFASRSIDQQDGANGEKVIKTKMTKIFGTSTIRRDQTPTWNKYYGVSFKHNRVKMHDSLIAGKYSVTSKSDFFDVGK